MLTRYLPEPNVNCRLSTSKTAIMICLHEFIDTKFSHYKKKLKNNSVTQLQQVTQEHHVLPTITKYYVTE